MARFPFLGTDVEFPPTWWDKLENSEQFQTISTHSLAAAYGIISLVALVQLIRIQLRVPHFGWTTQKVFFLLNFFVCGSRCGVFAFRAYLEGWHSEVSRLILFDLPGLLFFTTYTLLVLFWAEIYYQALLMPTSSLRPKFIGLNVSVYALQAGLWVLQSRASGSLLNVSFVLSNCFLAAVSVIAAVGFSVYGGRLWLMLQRFPIDSRGRKKKLVEVGVVTVVCAACFSLRAVLVALTALDRADLELDVLGHPLLNMVYYTTVEILPSACVLFILRKLPPRRVPAGYTPLPTPQES